MTAYNDVMETTQFVNTCLSMIGCEFGHSVVELGLAWTRCHMLILYMHGLTLYKLFFNKFYFYQCQSQSITMGYFLPNNPAPTINQLETLTVPLSQHL